MVQPSLLGEENETISSICALCFADYVHASVTMGGYDLQPELLPVEK